MASIINDPNGRKRIQFRDKNGTRKTIRLGKIDLKGAENVRHHVEVLVNASLSGQPVARSTALWVAGIGGKLKDKLAAVGLIEATPRATLGNFLTDFIANRRATAKPSTITNMEQAARRLMDYFGADRPIATITTMEAEKWAAMLHGRYAPATAGRAVKRARQFFKVAVRHKLITENPFTNIKASTQTNPDRQVHVPREVIDRVIDAAPDAEWRLIIALSRYAALRCPSETLALQWSDINWERDRFRVQENKTRERWVPIFPELRPYLEAAYEQAPPGATYVITRYRGSETNLRTQFQRIIRRAGETPWPKLFHNLRASRETELAAEFPIHVVCAWIGNSPAIAAKHYLTVQDSDFAKAAQKEAHSGAIPKGMEVNSSTEHPFKTLGKPLDSIPYPIVYKREDPRKEHCS